MATTQMLCPRNVWRMLQPLAQLVKGLRKLRTLWLSLQMQPGIAHGQSPCSLGKPTCSATP